MLVVIILDLVYVDKYEDHGISVIQMRPRWMVFLVVKQQEGIRSHPYFQISALCLFIGPRKLLNLCQLIQSSMR